MDQGMFKTKIGLPLVSFIILGMMLGGGIFVYPSRMVSPVLAFSGVWVYALASFFGLIILVDMGSILKSGLFIIFIGSGILVFYLRKKYLATKGETIHITGL